MQQILVFAILAQILDVQASNAHASATPISKVIQLLSDMAVKAEKEKKDEATRFSAFSQWCDDQTRIKTDEINAGTQHIELLTAKIEKTTVSISHLTERIQELEEDVGRWTKDVKSATEVRDKENVDYKATIADFGESLDALRGALTTLKARAHKTAQADEYERVLLQISKNRLVPDGTKQALQAFLQYGQPAETEVRNASLDYEAPEAYGYEFQSGGVIDILERLQDEFEKKKYELDREEMQASHAFQQIEQMLTDSMENANHEIQKRTVLRAQAQKLKAQLIQERTETEAERAEDQKYLDGTTNLCNQKKLDFDSRQTLRAEELDKLHEAIDILSSHSVSGAGEKHLPSFSQRSALGLLQMGNGNGLSDQAVNILESRVAAFLADRAKSCNSRILALAAQGAAANPFVKVKKMIKDLISKLTQEATGEIEHKGWCDTELTTNKQTREQKTDAVEELAATKEEQIALIAQLTQTTEELTFAVKELDEAMAKAVAERQATKETNMATIKDAEEAQAAVQQAIVILKDFYAKSAQATDLVQAGQSPAEDAPETFDKAYKGLLPEGGNVVDFLEVILTDFMRLESETRTSEQADLDMHKAFMFESEKDKAVKLNSKAHKDDKRKATESALQATEEELKLTQNQLDKAIAYYEKLKPPCVDSGITYEERVKLREEEIQSLQEALKILTGTDLS